MLTTNVFSVYSFLKKNSYFSKSHETDCLRSGLYYQHQAKLNYSQSSAEPRINLIEIWTLLEKNTAATSIKSKPYFARMCNNYTSRVKSILYPPVSWFF